MAIFTGETCSWCGNEDMTVYISPPEGAEIGFMLCIPCINEVYEDWKSEQTITPQLTRIK